MDRKSEKPLRLFVNPFAIWTDLVIKTGEAMWASAHAAALRKNAPKVAVLPAADAPPPKAQAGAAQPTAKREKRASKVTRFKAMSAKVRSKAKGKRR